MTDYNAMWDAHLQEELWNMGTKTFKIYGSGDDNVCFEGLDDLDEESAYFHDGVYAGQITVTEWDGTPTLEIYAIYAGFWAFAVGPANYDGPLPYKITRTFGEDCPYSETLSVEIPNNAVVTWEKAID